MLSLHPVAHKLAEIGVIELIGVAALLGGENGPAVVEVRDDVGTSATAVLTLDVE